MPEDYVTDRNDMALLNLIKLSTINKHIFIYLLFINNAALNKARVNKLTKDSNDKQFAFNWTFNRNAAHCNLKAEMNLVERDTM